MRPRETRPILEGESFSDIDQIQVQLQNPQVKPSEGSKGADGNSSTDRK
jgi:hypothetical protein